MQFVKFKAYAKDGRLCVYETLNMYTEKTEHIINDVDQENENLLALQSHT